MHVLILGARAPACLEWARAFRAAGWQVTAGDSLAWPLTRASNAIHHYLRLPEPRSETRAWLAALKAYIETHAVDLVLPTCEEAFYLAHGRDRLPCRVMTPDFALMHRLHHKGWFAEMIQDWPVAAPETHLLASREDVAAFIRSSFPRRRESRLSDPLDSRLRGNDVMDWVFKPAYSRFANRALIKPTAAALSDIRPTADQPWVAQRFVAGREHCSFSILLDGRLTAHACYHPRYRVGRGSGIWFEPTDPAPIRAFLERFGTQTGYTGQVAFDFIESPDGRCHAIECNPRATSGVHLFDDQPQALVAALLGAEGVLTPTAAPRQVALAMLLFAAPKHLFDRQFWRDYRRARDVVTRPGDRAPLPAQIPSLAEIVGRAIARRCGLLAAATADSEWNGQPMDALP